MNEIAIVLWNGFLSGRYNEIRLQLFNSGSGLEAAYNASYHSEFKHILPLTNEYQIIVGSIELSNIWFEAHNKLPLCKHTSKFDFHKDTSRFWPNCCLNQVYF